MFHSEEVRLALFSTSASGAVKDRSSDPASHADLKIEALTPLQCSLPENRSSDPTSVFKVQGSRPAYKPYPPVRRVECDSEVAQEAAADEVFVQRRLEQHSRAVNGVFADDEWSL